MALQASQLASLVGYSVAQRLQPLHEGPRTHQSCAPACAPARFFACGDAIRIGKLMPRVQDRSAACLQSSSILPLLNTLPMLNGARRAQYVLLVLGMLAFSTARAQSTRFAGAQAGLQAASTISGVVFDSLAGVPLRNALVQLVAKANVAQVRSVQSDTAGRFAFDSVAVGGYFLGFLHSKLDSLLLRPPVTPVDIGRGQATVDIALGIPSATSITALFCGHSLTGDQPQGIMLGRLRTADRAPVETGLATVRAHWRALRATGNGVRVQLDSSIAALRSSADFALCGLMPEGTFTVQAWRGTDSTGVVELTMPSDRIARRDLYLSRAPRVGQLVGAVRDSTGVGVARARVAATDRDITAQTDSSGRFVLSGLPLGSQSISVRALGYSPLRRAVDIVDGAEYEHFLLERVPTTLRVVTVRDRRSYSGFELRRASGTGLFLDEATIKRRKPWVFAGAARAFDQPQIQHTLRNQAMRTGRVDRRCRKVGPYARSGRLRRYRRRSCCRGLLVAR